MDESEAIMENVTMYKIHDENWSLPLRLNKTDKITNELHNFNLVGLLSDETPGTRDVFLDHAKSKHKLIGCSK